MAETMSALARCGDAPTSEKIEMLPTTEGNVTKTQDLSTCHPESSETSTPVPPDMTSSSLVSPDMELLDFAWKVDSSDSYGSLVDHEDMLRKMHSQSNRVGVSWYRQFWERSAMPEGDDFVEALDWAIERERIPRSRKRRQVDDEEEQEGGREKRVRRESDVDEEGDEEDEVEDDDEGEQDDEAEDDDDGEEDDGLEVENEVGKDDEAQKGKNNEEQDPETKSKDDNDEKDKTLNLSKEIEHREDPHDEEEVHRRSEIASGSSLHTLRGRGSIGNVCI